MIQIENVNVRSGAFALTNLTAVVAEGEYAVLMGGTGQGKTTILEAVCGLRPISSGRICLAGADVTHCKPADRSIGYVPQDLALFPTMTVRDHLEFALRLRRASTVQLRERIAELSDVLGIGPLLDRKMRGLSGGEAQRVALGRALSFRPRVLLLDEPLNALDEPTRDRLCELLRSVQKNEGLTTLHVTHSRSEARLLADKLLVLAGGLVETRPVSELFCNAPDGNLGKQSLLKLGSAYMRLRVQYTAQLRTAVGRCEQEVDLPDGSNLSELLVHVASELCRDAAGYILTSDGDLQPSLLVAVNNSAISTREARATRMKTGDVVMLLPPIAGG